MQQTLASQGMLLNNFLHPATLLLQDKSCDTVFITDNGNFLPKSVHQAGNKKPGALAGLDWVAAAKVSPPCRRRAAREDRAGSGNFENAGRCRDVIRRSDDQFDALLGGGAPSH